MSPAGIQAQLVQLGKLAEETRAAIAAAYPAGTNTGVLLSDAQKTPTPAVIGYPAVHLSPCSADAWGYVTVKIDTAKAGSRQAWRQVSIDMLRSL